MHTLIQLDTFARAYIAAAILSSMDDNCEPLDNNYSPSDIAPETLEKIAADCAKFQEQHGELLTAEGTEDYTFEQAGHDFWLTRNRHGAGFWDRNLPGTIGDQLTDAAHAFGECDLYVGDDGCLYI